MEATRVPIRGRLIALGVLSALGAVTFLPFLDASGAQPPRSLAAFAVIVTVVATLAAWPGLRCADAVGLPMPYLRRLDGAPAQSLASSAVAVTLVVNIALGVLGLVTLRLVHAPSLPGSAIARALSAIFAAGPLEIVLHLFVMSAVVWLARGRRWPGIVAAAAALVLFHLSSGASQPAALLAASVVANGTIGLVLGWIYARYGFELVVLGHAVAHLITVLLG